MNKFSVFLISLALTITLIAREGWRVADDRFSQFILYIVSWFPAYNDVPVGIFAKPTPYFYQENNAMALGISISIIFSVLAFCIGLKRFVNIGHNSISANIIAFTMVIIILNVQLISWL